MIHDISVVLQLKHCQILDIGCGASAVYSLLGCQLNSNFTFLNLEPDIQNFKAASDNISQNQLTSRIEIQNISLEKFENVNLWSKINFVICNPPFFNNQDQGPSFKNRTGRRKRNKDGCLTGGRLELAADQPDSETECGEVQLVEQIIQKSCQLPLDQRQIYSSMLGKKVSLKNLVPQLKKVQAQPCL